MLSQMLDKMCVFTETAKQTEGTRREETRTGAHEEENVF